eukprot:7487472-Pyramimonas_sp.AAC.1
MRRALHYHHEIGHVVLASRRAHVRAQVPRRFVVGLCSVAYNYAHQAPALARGPCRALCPRIKDTANDAHETSGHALSALAA